jgi:hypothetical protein
MVKKYGQTLLVTQDLALENYLERYAFFRIAVPLDPQSNIAFSRRSTVSGTQQAVSII